MKAFYSLFVALVSASYAFAISKNLKKHYYNSCLNELNILKKECGVFAGEYNASQLDNRCKEVNNSKKCQDFFKDPIHSTQMCRLASPYYAIPTYEIKTRNMVNKFFCEKTKNGDSCPALEMYKKDLTVEQEEELVLKNCKFSNCNNAYLEVVKADYAYAKSGGGYLEFIEKRLNLILSDECKGIKKATSTKKSTVKKTTTIAKKPSKAATTTVPIPNISPAPNAATTTVPVVAPYISIKPTNAPKKARKCVVKKN